MKLFFILMILMLTKTVFAEQVTNDLINEVIREQTETHAVLVAELELKQLEIIRQ